jgi:hypothetical protein
MDRIEIKTKSGFEAVIDPAALDDMELLEDMSRMDAGEEWLAARVVARLLGAEQKRKLYEFCRNPETGRVSVTKVSEVLMELFSSDALKK